MDAVVGYVVALVLSMMGVAGFATWAKIGVTNVKAAATASQMAIFDQAAQQYVQDNATALAVQATTTVPVVLNAANLSSYLPAGFSGTNPFGQTWQLQVLKTVGGQLQSLVTSQNGAPISDTKQLVQIAAQAGAQGGFVPYANQAGDATMNPASAMGAYGGWKLLLANYANPGSGHLASLLTLTNVQSNNDYLYRVAVPGQSQLNQMETALDMNVNDIDHAGNVNAQGVNVQNASSAPTVDIGAGSVSYASTNQQLTLAADGGTQIMNAAGTSAAPLTAGNITGGILQPTTSATLDGACQQAGAIANSGTGPLFCQSNVWRLLRSSSQYAVDSNTPGVPSSSCNQALSVPIPGGTTGVFLTADGSCSQFTGGTCILEINGNKEAFSSTSSGYGSVASSWTPNQAQINVGSIAVLVQTYDGAGDAVCSPTYGRVDVIFFY
ncbi:shufflon system plasmid conjugative transfer pilus tip adhesin PilV [Trinickia acidisoli]|uniref:shufflon system plasmid conjugative transfer pilus tip adhesin PilV n=1 Tax=Trinickia acidisoli TaxID=2767482 RepID=UPI001A8C884B|nr:shufflon system plasmid conjugative transfer pilus tip adhesin PilV [Trinickia acidisoli]